MHYLQVSALKRFAAVVLAALVASCGGGKDGDSGTTTPSVTGKVITAITVTSTNVIVYVGSTQQLVSTATYADGTTAALTTGVNWTSDSAKASVSTAGIVIPASAGTVKLTATVGIVAGSLTLTVKGPYVAGSSGSNFSVFQKYDGSLASTGSNLKGQLGDAGVNRTTASSISTANKWKMVAAGSLHTLAVATDGTLWAWGSNTNGQLGDGSNTDRSSGPVQIGTLKTWDIVAAGKSHSLAIKTDKTLWAWGGNFNGQLGDSTIVDSSVPKQIGALKNWTGVSAGDTHSVAVNSLAEVYTWGSFANGQLGQGAAVTADVRVPTKILNCDTCTPINLSGIRVMAGANHTLVLRSDLALFAFGANSSGQLGIGSTTNEVVPTQVGTDKNWDRLAAGSAHTLATKVDGSLWAWGSNSNSQLGDGTITDQDAPMQIGTLFSWTSVFAGALQSFALTSDGSLWAWGGNVAGQLGLGTSVDATAPTKVP